MVGEEVKVVRHGKGRGGMEVGDVAEEVEVEEVVKEGEVREAGELG